MSSLPGNAPTRLLPCIIAIVANDNDRDETRMTHRDLYLSAAAVGVW